MYFSICIPTYNRAHTITRTLNSLVKQTFKDFEVIVVDDGSKDDTEKVVLQYKELVDLKYIKKENGGKHTALNKGIDKASGLFFMILDSDDWLVDNALELLHSLCEKIKDNENYSGVLCRCIDITTGKTIGDDIPDEYESLSYIDMHFVLRIKGINIGDCCECNKTSILKKYHFPEELGMKFVPEAWMFDQIGVSHLLLTTNKGGKICEYQDGGITLDTSFKIKNNKGYLYHYVSRIENILPNIKHSIKDEIIAWWRYWGCVDRDTDNLGQRVTKISFVGQLVRIGMPIINVFYRIRYRNFYKSGR
ncbi:glycosyltransferase family A protein [Clostridium sp.]